MDLADLSATQRALWQQVEVLWSLLGGDEDRIRAALHPRYAGWVAGDASPHDREAGVRAAASSPPLLALALEPLSVEVYGQTGVVHYRYRATLGAAAAPQLVTGRWTEVYADEGGTWLLVAVSGGPDRA